MRIFVVIASDVHFFFALCGFRLVMRPLSVPAASSMTALMSVGFFERRASSIARRNSAGVVALAPTVFVKNARYEMMMQAFGGVGVLAKNPAELEKALDEAIKSGKPTLINAIIDETAGTESGRITSLNPTAGKKK